ncbi:GyrI-like domain-containing protein [Stenotrophomonas maltophilia]|uniref:GyrI-like domain-containing protein n=1 Tax=Stenotrophomonas maltophilia TaxID=40324 RepID=UPI0013D9F85A|nr:GyrI-like domain-containing protein [Stenotrophomonas maltophilia]ELF4101511.1 GyrI-like domain-containing protein [Stenotrophomonas maltophilia]UQA71661.1 GyrI-like domain-containing protein [Stenotrophomonas maltophilia]WQI22247.1 GyrI-like domain-containing protein [Stenotrophomonas maltophilia]
MDKIDFKKRDRALYQPPVGRFVTVDVPPLPYVMVDGHGDPNTAPAYLQAVQWLYSVSYALKFALKAMGQDYVVPPLEALWSAGDPSSFVARRKDEWRWTVMIRTPNGISPEQWEAAIANAAKKLGEVPASLRHEILEEGLCLQTLHVGAYDDEGPILAHLHGELMPALGYTFAGPHHEIYLSDPRRTGAARLKTVLRQSVRNGLPAC